MKRSLSLAAIVLAFAASAHAQHVRPLSVALTNQFQGPAMCLDVVNGGPHDKRAEMRACGNFSGQQWMATPIGNTGYVTLTTAFRGPGMCLDVINGGPDNNAVWLEPCANVSGQHWKIQPTRTNQMRLSTEFRGANVCLDVANSGGPTGNNSAVLAPCENVSGQFWVMPAAWQ